MRANASYAIFFILLLFCTRAFATLNPPELQCIALDENDDVTLTWSIPNDPNAEFFKYVVFYKPNSGPFTKLQEVNSYTSTSVLIPGSFAGTVSFYIVTVSNGGADSSIHSDTISPIILSAFSTNREVNLQWTPLELPSVDSLYRIYRREAPAGAWQLVGTVKHPELTLKDTVDVCSLEVNYKVEVEGVSGCLNRSNVPTRLVEDKEPPLQTNLVCASVDPATGYVNIGWDKSASPDVHGYLLSYFEAFVRTDTVFGADSLSASFSKNGINALIRPETLSVAPFDSCFDSLAGWYNQAADSLRFRTLFVDTISYDRCAGKVGLQWNMPREGFPVGVRDLSAFRIYRQFNDGSPELRATLGAEDSIFLDSGLLKDNTYTYVIAAYDESRDKEAFSNPYVLVVAPPKVPEYVVIGSIVNNHESGLNQVNVWTDITGEAVQYGLFRSLTESGGYQIVARSMVTNKDLFAIEDPTGRADQTDYYYKVAAYDLCGEIIAWSLSAKSMFLDGFKIEQDYLNTLEWTPYEGYEIAGTSVDSYVLYRTTHNLSPESIFSASQQFAFEDDILPLEYVDGRVCYYVMAEDAGTSSFGQVDDARSNLFCLDYGPRVLIPNAFSPDDDNINDRFLPDVNFVDPTGYTLMIYDRSGTLIHTTNDPAEGWDGGDRGIGVYAYHLQLINALGEAVNMTGKVHLIR